MRKVLATLSFLIFFAFVLFAQEARSFFPNSTISLVLPKHFEKTDLYEGFIHKPTSTSLIAKKVAGQNCIAFQTRLTNEYFRSQQLTVIKTEKLKAATWEGTLYHLSFEVENTKMERMMLVTGDYNDTYILMSNFPAMFSSQLYVMIRQSFLTLQF